VRCSETIHDAVAPDGSRAASAFDDLTAVIVDWNLPEHAIHCARTLVADGIPPGRIVVVESGSTDENWSRISAELSSCILVRTGANVGFGTANNIGARALPGRAYLLVNNDAFVHRAGSVSKLLQALGAEGIGIVVPRLLNADLSLQPTVAPFSTPLSALVRASGLSRFIPDRWQPHLSTHWDHGASRVVEAAIGAVMLVDGQVWDRLGGFRETSFMYAEDIDLCWRARNEGWATWFAGEAEFVHVGGASSDQRWTSRERSDRIGRAEAAMIRGQLSPARAAAAIAFMRFGLAVRVAYFSLVRKSSAAASCLGSFEGLGRAGADERADEGASVPTIEVVRPGH
jgi:N-acetylglucosaminyl-diphospho-decaprenol L-rhamnosyltransferase